MAPQQASKNIRVLVVDDSAVVRQALTAILTSQRDMSVTTAPDPVIALTKIAQSPPDVIVLDLEMPRMDGLTFLRKLMSEQPLPVIVCSGLVGSGTDASLRALEEGAVEVVAKPKLGVRDFIEDSALMFVDAVRAAAAARVRRRAPLPIVPRVNADAVLPPRQTLLRVTTDKVIAVGASTGGTEALREFLQAMPPDCPGIVVVQHMPEMFTAAFANRLNQLCRIEVKEAATGDRVTEGRALIAPGNLHLMLRRTGAHYIVETAGGPLVSRHRPSVDVLFRSVAQAAGPNSIGIIMTGMGDDGAAGLLEMKQAGARTLAQDEASCVVFGMPKEAILRGAVDDVVPLSRLAYTAMRR